MRQFNVGQVVTYIPETFLRPAASGDYRVVGAIPDRDGDHMYRIKSPLEEHERVVKESLLVKSDGYLPQEVPKLACTRFRRHRVRCFDGTGGGSWRDGSLLASSSLRLCA